MKRTNASAIRKKVKQVNASPKMTPETLLETPEKKLKVFFSKLHNLLRTAEEKTMKFLAKLAALIRKYWEFLIVPTRILILILKKAREQNCLSCKES